MVSPIGSGFQFYHGDNPNCRPKDVPGEFWKQISKETDNPWQQYNQLKAWAKSGDQLIRNVRLYKSETEPQWQYIGGA